MAKLVKLSSVPSFDGEREAFPGFEFQFVNWARENDLEAPLVEPDQQLRTVIPSDANKTVYRALLSKVSYSVALILKADFHKIQDGGGAWQRMRRTYLNEDPALVNVIRTRITNTRLEEGISPVLYIGQVLELYERLANATGEKPRTIEVRESLLCGLPPSFKLTAMFIRKAKPQLTTAEICTSIMDDYVQSHSDARLGVDASRSTKPAHVVHVTTRSTEYQRGGYRGGGSGRGRGRGNGSPRRNGFCNNCGKFGHFAAECRSEHKSKAERDQIRRDYESNKSKFAAGKNLSNQRKEFAPRSSNQSRDKRNNWNPRAHVSKAVVELGEQIKSGKSIQWDLPTDTEEEEPAYFKKRASFVTMRVNSSSTDTNDETHAIIDQGANITISGNLDALTELDECGKDDPISVVGTTGGPIRIVARGILTLVTGERDIRFPCYYSPEVNSTILGIKNCMVVGSITKLKVLPGHTYITWGTGDITRTIRNKNGLDTLPIRFYTEGEVTKYVDDPISGTSTTHQEFPRNPIDYEEAQPISPMARTLATLLENELPTPTPSPEPLDDASVPLDIWHQRLGHRDKRMLRRLPRHVQGMHVVCWGKPC